MILSIAFLLCNLVATTLLASEMPTTTAVVRTETPPPPSYPESEEETLPPYPESDNEGDVPPPPAIEDISDLSSYKEWLNAPTSSLKGEAAGRVLYDLIEEAYRAKSIKERIALVRQGIKFLGDNKAVMQEDEFKRFEQQLKDFETTQLENEKRHAGKLKLSASLERDIENGDVKAAIAYLEKHPEQYEAINDEGNTPLMIALYQEKLSFDLINHLMQHAKNLSMRNDHQDTLLHILASSRDSNASKLVEMLLKKGADIEAKDVHNNTPLLSALDNVEYANIPVIRVLLQNKADIHARGDMGSVAALAIKPLRENTQVCPGCGQVHKSITPQEQVELVRLLLAFGVDAKEMLFKAIEFYNEPVVRLLANRENIETVYNINTPLLAAIQSAISTDDADALKRRSNIIRLLLELGANTENNGKTTETPLQYAIRISDVAIVRLLLDAGANTEGALDYAKVVTDFAENHGNGRKNQQIIELLKSQRIAGYKQTVERAKEALAQPLNLAGQPELGSLIKEYLTETPADTDIAAFDQTKEALRTNNKKLFNDIIFSNENLLWLTDQAGDSLLHLAVTYDRPDRLAIILRMMRAQDRERYRTMLAHRNNRKKTALELARELKYSDLVKELEQAEQK